MCIYRYVEDKGHSEVSDPQDLTDPPLFLAFFSGQLNLLQPTWYGGASFWMCGTQSFHLWNKVLLKLLTSELLNFL